jgi:uncharacterized membrane protein
MHTRPLLLIGASLLLLLACPVAAQVRADPYLPPDKRTPSAEVPAAGAALHQQALRKLRQRFDEADLDADGTLTLEEAKRAQLGFIANHFSSIDRGGQGKVSFADLDAFMEQRRLAATKK